MEIEEARRQLHAAADAAAMRGSLIFHLDLATEAARVAFAGRGIPTGSLATVIDEGGYRVFALDRDVSPDVIADARFDRVGNVVIDTVPDDVPPRVSILAKARATTEGTLAQDACLPHAVIVIPASDPRAPIEAYAIAVGASDLPRLNENWLLTLTRDGRIVTSCGVLSMATGGGLRSGLVYGGSVPNALHTYLSLKHGLSLFVETTGSGLRWQVAGERTMVANGARPDI